MHGGVSEQSIVIALIDERMNDMDEMTQQNAARVMHGIKRSRRC